MSAAKRRFFRTRASKRARARFVKQQRRKLARLKRARARCLARQIPAPGPPAPDPRGGPPTPPPEPPATSVIGNVVSPAASFEPGEVSEENGVHYVRTQLELELASGATIPASEVTPVRPQLASFASGAWNARAALSGRTPPTLLVTDYWGSGPPGPEVAVQETAADFATGNPSQHGYMMLGLLAGTFAPNPVLSLAVDQVTGTWPGPDLPLRVTDLRISIAGSTLEDRIVQMA